MMKRALIRSTMLLAALAATLGIIVSAPAAYAEEPFDAGSALVVDEADALTPGEETSLTAELEQTKTDTGESIHLVYVDTFSGMDPGTWASQTAQMSGYGSHDAMVAVAVVDRQIWEWDPAGGGHWEILANLVNEDDDVYNQLVDGNWAGAGNVIATKFAALYASKEAAPMRAAITIGIILVLGATTVIVVIVVRRRKFAARVKALGVEAGQAVLRLDEAFKAANEELAFAEASFAAADIAPLKAQVEQLSVPSKALLESFTALDEGAKDKHKEAVYQEVLGSANTIIDGLTEQATLLETWRSWAQNAPSAAEEFRGRAAKTEQMLAAAVTRMDESATKFATSELAEARQGTGAIQARIDDAGKNVELALAGVSGGRTGYDVISYFTSADASLHAANSGIDADFAVVNRLDEADVVAKQQLNALVSAINGVEPLVNRARTHGITTRSLNDASVEARGIAAQGFPAGPYDPVAMQESFATATNRLRYSMQNVEVAIAEVIRAAEEARRAEQMRRYGGWGSGGSGSSGGGWSSGGGGGGHSSGGSFGGHSSGGSFGGHTSGRSF